MHLGIDATCWSNPRGFGRYARSLSRALVASRGPHRVTLVADREPPASDLALDAEWSIVPTRESLDQGLHRRRSVRDLLRMARCVSNQCFDLFFFPSIDSFFPVWKTTLVATCHDTIPEAFPHLLSLDWKSRWLRKLKMRLALMFLKRMVTGSQREADRIGHYLGVSARSLAVVPYGVDSLFHDRSPGEGKEPWILHVGGPGPHKNERRLFEAFAACGVSEARLVLVGRWPPELVPDHPRIECRGYCDDNELKSLYRRASLVVVPSLEEGCGLPALEAVACGTPAVVTCNSPLPGLLGAAARVVNPESVEQLAEAMAAGLSADFPQARAASLGHAYTWEASARAAWEVFEATGTSRSRFS